MAFERFQDNKRGDKISAAKMNRLYDVAQRAAAMKHASGQEGVYLPDIEMHRPVRPPPLIMVRAKQDIRVEATEDFKDNPPPAGENNAVVQVWDDHARNWSDVEVAGGEKQEIYVTPSFNLPIRKDQLVYVRPDPTTGRYFPVSQEETRFVFVTSIVPNEDGFLPGILQFWNSDTGEWEDGEEVHVLDPNA